MTGQIKAWWKRRRCSHDVVKIIDGVSFPDRNRELGISTQLMIESFHYECRKCDATGKTEAL